VELLQPCVFSFGFFQDGDVGVGVFPEVEEVLVSGAGLRASKAARARRASSSSTKSAARSPSGPSPGTVIPAIDPNHEHRPQKTRKRRVYSPPPPSSSR